MTGNEKKYRISMLIHKKENQRKIFHNSLIFLSNKNGRDRENPAIFYQNQLI